MSTAQIILTSTNSYVSKEEAEEIGKLLERVASLLVAEKTMTNVSTGEQMPVAVAIKHMEQLVCQEYYLDETNSHFELEVT